LSLICGRKYRGSYNIFELETILCVCESFTCELLMKLSVLVIPWLGHNDLLYLMVWHNGRFSEFAFTRILTLVLVLAEKLENVRLFLR